MSQSLTKRRTLSIKFWYARKSMLVAKETRLSPRTRIQAQIVFKIPMPKGKENFLTLHSENVSEGGVFLKLNSPKLPFSVGMVVSLHFSLPDSPVLIRAKGKVIWTTEGPISEKEGEPEGMNGMGIQFTEMKEEFRVLIRRFVVENFDK